MYSDDIPDEIALNPYLVRTIYHIWQRQAQFKQYLAVNTDMNSYRYIRLMCLAGLEAICTVPLATYVMVRNIRVLRPVVSWAAVHWRFSRVSQFPSMLWRYNKDAVFALELTRWSPVICAFMFFFFFGFADEARKNYRLAYTSVAKRLGYSMASTSTAASSTTEFVHLLSSTA
jgi:pheromone a factor receptor